MAATSTFVDTGSRSAAGRPRTAAGVPAGGEFAAKAHAEADLTLAGGMVGDSDGPEGLFRPGRTMPEVQSHSSLSDFSFCPTKWALSRIDGAEIPTDADETLRWSGIVAHRAAELESGGLDADAAFDAAMDEHPGAEWYRAFRAGGGSAADLGDPETCPADAPADVVAARNAATSFGDWERTDPLRPSLVAAEYRVDAEIDGVELTGVIDAVDLDDDGAVVVTDYKTGKPPAKAALDGDDDLARFDDGATVMYPAKVTRQLVLYAEMAEETGRHVDRVRLLYPATRQFVEVDLEGPYGDHLRAEARQFVAAETARLAEAHETGVFPARPSPKKCAVCAQAQNCPAAA
jgi:CRISPR/Cas system-associated exonuclease Cas4 (RecB family)